jgi:hypothetical protein
MRDLWEPRELILVGHGRLRRGCVVTTELCWSTVAAGDLIFSKEAPGTCGAWAAACAGWKCCRRSWCRIGRARSTPAADARPTSSPFCGQLEVGWIILAASDSCSTSTPRSLASRVPCTRRRLRRPSPCGATVESTDQRPGVAPRASTVSDRATVIERRPFACLGRSSCRSSPRRKTAKRSTSLRNSAQQSCPQTALG